MKGWDVFFRGGELGKMKERQFGKGHVFSYMFFVCVFFVGKEGLISGRA